MYYAKLGQTGPVVSRVAVGSDVNVPPGDFISVLRRGWELGINFVDTDHSYGYHDPTAGRGQMWEAIRHWLTEVDRSKVVVATKTYQPSFEGALKDVEQARVELRTDYLDVFMLHGLNTLEDWERFEPALEGLMEARERGWVHRVGMSTHTVTLTREAAHHPELEVLLVTLNKTGRTMKRSGTSEEMQEAMRVLYEQGRGLYIMKSLARGRVFSEGEAGSSERLTPRMVDEALTYVFECPWAHAVTIGMRSVTELEEDVAIEQRVDAERRGNASDADRRLVASLTLTPL